MAPILPELTLQMSPTSDLYVRIIINGEMGGMWRYYPRIGLAGLRKTARNMRIADACVTQKVLQLYVAYLK
jgi:hypothetical protein